MKQWILSLSLLFFTASCQGKPEYQFLPEVWKFDLSPFLVLVLNPGDLSQSSAADYNENKSGLITSSTLSTWLSNWSNAKPNTSSGNLVVFQLQTGATRNEFPLAIDPNVYVYHITNPTGVFSEPRDNGVLNGQVRVPKGKKMNDLLAVYGIDPLVDHIVFLADTSNTLDIGAATYGYYVFLYWGYPKERLALVQGNLADLGSSGTDEVPTSISLGLRFSGRNGTIQSLLRDQTSIQVTLGDVLFSLRGGESLTWEADPLPAAGIWNVDGRSTFEFNGDLNATASTPLYQSCTAKTNSLFATNTCLVAHEGRWRNANSIPNELLFSSNRWKTKTEIESIFQTAGYISPKTVFAYGRNPQQGSIIWFASHQILGFPTRLYEAGWEEFGALGNRAPLSGQSPSSLTQSASPWRTDLISVSSNINTNPDSNVPNYGLDLSRQFSKNANAIRREDKEFLRGSTLPTTGTGGGPTGGGGNACGG